MAKDKGDKTPSADEIIEALAIDLGVDEGDAKKGDAKKKATRADDAKASSDDTIEEVEAGNGDEAKPGPASEADTPPQPVKRRPKAKAKPPKTPTSKKKKAESEKPAPAQKAKDDHRHEHIATQEEVADVVDGEHGLDALFNISGEGGDPYVQEYYDPDLDADEVRIGGGWASGLMRVLLVVIVTGALIGGTYLAVPDEYRQDIGPLLSCEDVQSQRRERRRLAAEEERREWLASQPKYGTLTILTRPGFSRVVVEGQPTYTEHPNRDDTLVETRSGTTFADLDITQGYNVSVTLPNYQDYQLQLLPYDQVDSQWQQRQDDGAWFLEMNELLAPDPMTAEELRLRMTSAEAPDLMGEITVRTNPAGANVFYNNRMLVDEEGTPLTTPLTFSSYPPPPPQPAEGTGEQPVQEVPTEPIPVTLRATGVPIRVELEGYMPVATGVYRHMFTCNLREDVAEDAPFWERCQYTYNTGVLELMTPAEFAPPGEGSGEGTGQGAEASGNPQSG